MRKLLVILSLIAATQLMAEEKTYVFEAKGKFAEELKALVEKHSKDGKVDVTVYENPDMFQNRSQKPQKTFLQSLLGPNEEDLQYADIKEGEALYQKSCASCHGKSADLKRYPEARVLNTIKPMEIVDQLKGYKLDDDGKFGGSTKFLMKPQADALSTEEMQSIAVYIYSLKNGKDLSNIVTKKDEVDPTEPVQGSYLK